MFWYAVLYVMGRLGLLEPYCKMIDILLDGLVEEIIEEAEN